MTTKPPVKQKVISFSLDPDLHKEFKIACIEDNTNIKAWLIEQIKRKVQAHKKS